VFLFINGIGKEYIVKATIKTKELKNALVLHKHNCRKNTVCILDGVKLKANNSSLEIVSTNLEQSLKTKLESEVSKDGEAIVPFKVISNTLNYCDTNYVDIELTDKNELKVDKLKINCLDLKDYPEFPVFKDGITLKKLDFGSFVSSINKIKDFYSTDEARIILTGILFDTTNNCLVATDSYKLGISKYYFGRDVGKFVIPNQVYNILKDIYKCSKDDKFTMLIEDNQVCFVVSNNVLFSRIISGKFPEYEQLIPASYNYRCNINSKELIRILDKSRKVINGPIPVKLKFNSTTIDITKTCKEIGVYEDKANISSVVNNIGENVEMGFNGDFLRDCISNFDNVNVSIQDKQKPLVFNNDDEYKTILMPIRIS